MSGHCPTCNVPWTDHGGIAVTCAEVQRLRDEVASLRITAQAFASCLLSVRKQNTDEWMDYAAGVFNDLCDVLKTGDRFQYDGRDGLRKVK